ncbi:MAG TPA: branched-chain amino acid ABC transporter permease [Coriobacteriia bacterium]
MAVLRRMLPGAVVAVLVLGLPLVVHDRYLLKVLSFVGIDVVVVLGLALLFGFAGQISLGQAAFFGIGAYTTSVLVAALGWPWLGGVAAAVLVSAGAGALLALPVGRLKGHYLAMATLGFGEIALIAFTELKGITGGTDGLSGIPYPQVGSFVARAPEANYLLVWAVAIVAYVLAANVVALRPGRALRALHGSEAGAQASGIDVARTKVTAFAVAAGLAGLGGALYAHLVGFISPGSFTIELSILLVAMVALGGMGSLPGAVVGAVLLGMLPYLDAVVPGLTKSTVEALQSWEADIYGAVLILVMLFMPHGLAGAFRRFFPGRGGEGS